MMQWHRMSDLISQPLFDRTIIFGVRLVSLRDAATGDLILGREPILPRTTLSVLIILLFPRETKLFYTTRTIDEA